MKELNDLATHPFLSKSPTQVPNFINFTAELLGDGVLGVTHQARIFQFCIYPVNRLKISYG